MVALLYNNLLSVLLYGIQREDQQFVTLVGGGGGIFLLTCNRCAYMVQAYCVNYDYYHLNLTPLPWLLTLHN